MAHRWTVQDDILALYLYRCGEGDIGTFESLGSARGMGADSLKLRLRNISSLETGTGLNHVAKQTRDVYRRYKNTPCEELKRLALE